MNKSMKQMESEEEDGGAARRSAVEATHLQLIKHDANTAPTAPTAVISTNKPV